MQTLNVDLDWQAKIIEKTLTLPNHEDMIKLKQEENKTH